MIHIAQPQIGKAAKRAVVEVLDSGMLAQGEKVREFEERFADYVGADHAVAVGNGTQALHLALLAHGIGPGDRVATTPFSFVSSASAILMTGAEVVFVDIDPDTFTIDPSSALAPHIDALIPVHLYGHPADMWFISDAFSGIPLVWDACQAHGAMVSDENGIYYGVGSPRPSRRSSISCWSFYATKNMTTGEGGMLTTSDEGLAGDLRQSRNHGQDDRYSYAQLGYNYRMTEIQAAIGISQIDFMQHRLYIRGKIAKDYNEFLRDDGAIVKPRVKSDVMHAWHQYTIRVPNERDALKAHLEAHDIYPRIYYPTPLHKTKLFQNRGCTQSYPNAERAAREVLSLPIHPGLTQRQINLVIETVNSWDPN